MAAPTFDLIDVIRTIQKQKKFIIVMTALAMLLGATFVLVKVKKYKAAGRFFVNNPLYGDRSTIFRSIETRYVDYFGGDDDLDKVTALAGSDTVKDRIIRNCQFQEVYKMDINDPKGHAALMNIFNQNFSLKRSEYKDIEVFYTAYDPQTAANVTNMAMQVLEESFRHYYTSMKGSICFSIAAKIKELDSSINVLTDTLANIRDKYAIYAIISPARQNATSQEIKGGGKGYGKAMEEIQNIESVKDQLVADRAHYISTQNEFSATANSAIDFIKVTTRAVAPTAPAGPGMLMMLMVAGGLGLFFSVIYVLMIAYFRKLNAVVR